MLRWLFAILFTVNVTAVGAADFRTGPEGAFVSVDGARLWYWTEGTGEPLLLIEGGPGAAGYLDLFFKDLTDHFTVIHLRGLGRGQSDRAASAADYSFDRDVADVEGFRRALGLASFNLFGHSYGGAVATAYALKYPASVKRLVLANSVLSSEGWQAGIDAINAAVRDQYPEVWEKLLALRARGLRSNAPECIEAWKPVSELLTYVASLDQAGKVQGEFNFDVFYAICGSDADFQLGGSMVGLDFRPRLHELKMPVLITASRFDRVVIPRFALQYRTAAPQAEFVLFEQSGHNVFLEEHEKFIATLRSFLTR